MAGKGLNMKGEEEGGQASSAWSDENFDIEVRTFSPNIPRPLT